MSKFHLWSSLVDLLEGIFKQVQINQIQLIFLKSIEARTRVDFKSVQELCCNFSCDLFPIYVFHSIHGGTPPMIMLYVLSIGAGA